MSTTENPPSNPSIKTNLSRRAFVQTVGGLAVSAGLLAGITNLGRADDQSLLKELTRRTNVSLGDRMPPGSVLYCGLRPVHFLTATIR